MVQIFLWNLSGHSRHAIGDFISVIPDNIHPGTEHVSGGSWDDPVTKGHDEIIDVTDVSSVRYVYRKFADHIASSFGYSGTPTELYSYHHVITFDHDQFPESVRTSLATNGRASMVFDDLWNAIGFTNSTTSGSVEAWVTQDYTLDASDIPYF